MAKFVIPSEPALNIQNVNEVLETDPVLASFINGYFRDEVRKKLRICRMYRITFECEGRVQALPFVVDKSLTIPGLLGKVAIEILKK